MDNSPKSSPSKTHSSASSPRSAEFLYSANLSVSTSISAASTPSTKPAISAEAVLKGQVRGMSPGKRQDLLSSRIGSIAVLRDGTTEILEGAIPLKLVVHFAPRLQNYWARTLTHGDLIVFDHSLRDLPVSRLDADAVKFVAQSLVAHVRSGAPHAVPFTREIETTIRVFYALQVFGMAGLTEKFRDQLGWLLRRKYGSLRRQKGAFNTYLESLGGLCDPKDALLDAGYECLYRKSTK